MEVPAVLRDARRRAGLSVRGAAARCDVPRATWAAWESGATSPTARKLDTVLAVLGLDLRLVDRPDELPEQQAVHRHLRLSVSVRARAALGPFLTETAAACRFVPRLLGGPAAVGVWVPGVVAEEPVPLLEAPPDAGLVPVRLDVAYDHKGRSLALVPPPSYLLSAGADERWPALLTAAQLLHERGPVDAAGRRLPAHRDPDEDRELGDLAQTLTWGSDPRVPVTPLDSRAWRLDGPATLDDALRRRGFRVRHLR